MSALLEAALDYAQQGRAVFPLIAYRKEPATRRGFYDATTNPATIRRWWMARPDYNSASAPAPPAAYGFSILIPMTARTVRHRCASSRRRRAAGDHAINHG